MERYSFPSLSTFKSELLSHIIGYDFRNTKEIFNNEYLPLFDFFDKIFFTNKRKAIEYVFLVFNDCYDDFLHMRHNSHDFYDINIMTAILRALAFTKYYTLKDEYLLDYGIKIMEISLRSKNHEVINAVMDFIIEVELPSTYIPQVVNLLDRYSPTNISYIDRYIKQIRDVLINR